MSQVNIIQYAEIYTGSGPPLRIGSKVTPSTITLTGTGEVYHRVFNDVPAATVTDLYTADLTGLKFFAVKSTLAAYVGFSENSDQGDGASIINIPAGVWQFFGGGSTGADNGSFTTRLTATYTTPENITIVKIAIPGLASSDVEFVGVY